MLQRNSGLFQTPDAEILLVFIGLNLLNILAKALCLDV